jgi:hypothetical protein
MDLSLIRGLYVYHVPASITRITMANRTQFH